MTTFVKKYVMDYDICQQMKNHIQQPFGPLVPNKMPNEPWEIISIDLIMQLSELNSYDTTCIIVDRLTKRAYFIPINSYYITRSIYCMNCPYKSFQIKKYNTQLSYFKNGVRF